MTSFCLAHPAWLGFPKPCARFASNLVGLRQLTLCLFILVVLRRAWMCDDAFITVRAVQNVVAGQSFAYNGDERVQAFTNPLWALLLILPAGVANAPFWGPLLTGILVSATSIALFLRSRFTLSPLGPLLVVLLCFSRSFVDFSTSGLENPLTHLLIVLMAIELYRPTMRALPIAALASLLFINRMDTALIAAPVVVAAFWESPTRRTLAKLIAGAVPALVWLGFSVVYFGFPFPNTAYAKLNLDVSRLDVFEQGVSYAFDALVRDPLLVGIIALGMLVGIASIRTEKRAAALVIGALLYSVYIVLIGGDFMSGRLWTPVLMLCTILLVRHSRAWLASRERLWVAGMSAAVLALSSPFVPFREDPWQEPSKVPPTGIANERAWHEGSLAAWRNVRVRTWQTQGFYLDGKKAALRNERVHVFGYIGQFGLAVGPAVHVIDDLALADALLARIPFKAGPKWRIGHYKRPLPEGYLDSVRLGRNVIRDRCIRAYYDDLSKITYGGLWSSARWHAIWRLNQPENLRVIACPG